MILKGPKFKYTKKLRQIKKKSTYRLVSGSYPLLVLHQLKKYIKPKIWTISEVIFFFGFSYMSMRLLTVFEMVIEIQHFNIFSSSLSFSSVLVQF